MQIRNNVPAECAAIQWINFGFFAYSPYVPFFTNINDTPAAYNHAGNKVDDSAYWLQKQLEVIVEPHYHESINEVNAFRDTFQSYAVKRVDMITALAKTKQGDAVTDFLTKRNEKTANHAIDATKDLLNSLIHQALLNSKFQFERGDNY